MQRFGQLAPARRQLAQPVALGNGGGHVLPGEPVGGKSQDQGGIHAIGFGQDAAAAAEGHQAIGMHPQGGHAALAQGGKQRAFIAPGRLQGDQRRVCPVEPDRDRRRGIGDPHPLAAAAQIEPFFRKIDADNRLVTHLRPPHNHRTACSARRIAMRAKALSIVRVSDRDAGGSEVPTVAGPIQGSKCPPASPSRRWRSNYAIQEHRLLKSLEKLVFMDSGLRPSVGPGMTVLSITFKLSHYQLPGQIDRQAAPVL